MALEELEITKDNLSKDIFLSLLANVSEQYNILLKKETITLDDTTKILSQIMEAYSFFNTIQQSELTQELSEARIQLNQIATTFQNLEQFKGEKGDKGDNGNDGTPFTYDMFTPEQLELLRGLQGERGEKGLDGTMTFEDLTPEQIALLKGDKGDDGIDGTPFTYDMFTPEQLELLKGAKGDTGDDGIDGTPFTYDMFTPEQLALLKGAKGDKGEAGTTDYNNLLNKPSLLKYCARSLSFVTTNSVALDFTPSVDTHNIYNATTKKIKIPKTALYKITLNALISNIVSASGYCSLNLYYSNLSSAILFLEASKMVLPESSHSNSIIISLSANTELILSASNVDSNHFFYSGFWTNLIIEELL